MRVLLVNFILILALGACQAPVSGPGSASDSASGAVLPFPPSPSASIAGESLAESKHVRRTEANHLPKDAPNIIIVLMDDVGFGSAFHFWRRDQYTRFIESI